MPTMDELEYGDEIQGAECETCGGSLIWRNARMFCDYCGEYIVGAVRHEDSLDIPAWAWGDEDD